MQIKFAWVCRNIHFDTIERVELTDEMLLSGMYPSWITTDNCEIIAKILPTGLPDKNGVEIYESDVIQCVCDMINIGTNKPTGKTSTENYIVKWEADKARWGLWNIKKDRFEVLSGFDKEALLKWYTIIGDIHSSPELIPEGS